MSFYSYFYCNCYANHYLIAFIHKNKAFKSAQKAFTISHSFLLLIYTYAIFYIPIFALIPILSKYIDKKL